MVRHGRRRGPVITRAMTLSIRGHRPHRTRTGSC